MRVVLRVGPLLLVVLNGIAFHPTKARAGVRDGFFVTSDGVRLHYLETGPPAGRTIVLVPGWTMPAWIWAPQIAAFSRA